MPSFDDLIKEVNDLIAELEQNLEEMTAESIRRRVEDYHSKILHCASCGKKCTELADVLLVRTSGKCVNCDHIDGDE